MNFIYVICLVSLVTCECFHSLFHSKSTNILFSRTISRSITRITIHHATQIEIKDLTLLDNLPITFIPLINEVLYSKSSTLTLLTLTNDIKQWMEALNQGYIPNIVSWPCKELHSKFQNMAYNINLPKLAQTHPSLIPTIIKSILELSIEHQKKINDILEKDIPNDNKIMDQEINEEVNWMDYLEENIENNEKQETQSINEKINDITNTLLRQYESKWTPALNGIDILDNTFGTKYSNNLINVNNNNNIPIDLFDETRGFGLFDGIWKHTGWIEIKELQERLSEMKEFREIIEKIGKRISITGNIQREMIPQIESKPPVPLGIARSSLIPNEMTSIKQSNELYNILNSEIILLLNNNLKKLFYLKYTEKTLLNYDITGWIEEYSINKPKNTYKYKEIQPIKNGGPIIICLDTSYSMKGTREILAKIVVLQACIIATKQLRKCYLINFSNNNNNNINNFEVSLNLNNKNNIIQLLDFLSHSFHGGTDVTTSLVYALNMISNKQNSKIKSKNELKNQFNIKNELKTQIESKIESKIDTKIDSKLNLNNNNEWNNADILLVTDGELQNPPVSSEILNNIRMNELINGLEIHSFLIGKNQSIPLDILCTKYDNINRIYDCLCHTKWDPLTYLQNNYFETQKLKEKQFFNSKTVLNAINPLNYHSKMIKNYKKKRLFHLFANLNNEIQTNINNNINLSIILNETNITIETIINEYNSMNENNENKSFDPFNLQLILNDLNKNLIEREMEIKLLLLAVLSNEHLLLFGPPGSFILCVLIKDNLFLYYFLYFV